MVELQPLNQTTIFFRKMISKQEMVDYRNECSKKIGVEMMCKMITKLPLKSFGLDDTKACFGLWAPKSNSTKMVIISHENL